VICCRNPRGDVRGRPMFIDSTYAVYTSRIIRTSFIPPIPSGRTRCGCGDGGRLMRRNRHGRHEPHCTVSVVRILAEKKGPTK
jgi:hypothetical protein